jgi:hypothetical protein
MPFRLKSASATYQRMMNAVLRGSVGNKCTIYMDDILIMGETLKEHDRLKEKYSPI